MKRGESYGGGQSSLGYLFGSDGDKQNPETPPPPPTTYAPPYGIDINTDDKPPENPFNSSQDKTKVIPNDYLRVQGQNSGNFITAYTTYGELQVFNKRNNDKIEPHRTYIVVTYDILVMGLWGSHIMTFGIKVIGSCGHP
ncbi:Uncharacterized protein Fot_09095 [Forsythia ovata]|uniref:Uncharacterized protein n=1 Tax=Forsythia ovata TaxID=205694 RepID=A0ABD1WGQ6_9LAMI